MNLPQKKAVFFAIVGVLVGLSVLWWLRDFFFAKRLDAGRSPLIEEMLLPTTVHPVHYDLTMKVFLPGYESHFPAEKNLTFDGKLVIRLVADEAIDQVTVNSKYLDFISYKCRFITEEGEVVKIVKITIPNPRLEKAIFKLGRTVPAGKHSITIVYSGFINDHLNGLYRTSYNTPEGIQKIAAVTKMEPYYARKMVPCFDEPSYKASWNVTVIHPKGTTALSNSIEMDKPEEEAGFLVTRFKKTPPMSSYLLAIFVSDFTFIEEHTQSGVRFRVWTRPEAQKSAEYALEAGIKCLDGYEKLFGVDFPLEKQDMVALPDFASGAMENWGMITYREYLLLFDKRNYYYQNKARVANVIAHELAHQWFGNLVTVKWWDDLWLQEGFASFVQAIGTDIIADGEFRMEEEFVTDQLRQSLELDGTAASHPIVFPTTRMEEIADLFDPISYRKGASVLAMIRNLLGKQAFIQGVQNYLKKYSYKNADHSDLFREWDEVVPKEQKGPDGQRLNITEFALRWTTQMGYPLLTATAVNSTHLTVKQERFKIDPTAKERPKFATSPYGYKWNVPLWVQNGSDPEIAFHWLPAEGDVVLGKGGGPLVVNADSYAVARMNYEEGGWQEIFEQLETDHSVYSPRTKYRIIADAFAAAAIEKIPYEVAFNVSNYLINEKEYLPWLAYITEMKNLFDLFGNLPQRGHLNNMVKRLIEPRFSEIDIRYTTRSMENNKAYMAGRLDVFLWVEYCKASPESCATTVKLYFNGALGACRDESAILSKCARIHPALRTYIYNEAVRTGGEEVFRRMLKFYQQETLQLEKERILLAVSSSTDPRLLTSLMSNLSSPSSEIFRLQDCPMTSVYLAQNKDACPLLLSYLIKHWEEFRQKFIENQVIMNQIISTFTCGVETEEGLAKLKTFVESSNTAGNYYMFTQQIQRSERRIAWLKKNDDHLEKVLDNMFV